MTSEIDSMPEKNFNFKYYESRAELMGRSSDKAVVAFRAKRKQPTQNKTIETYLKKQKSTEDYNRANELSLELEMVTLKEHGLTLQTWIEQLSELVESNEDITNDVKDIRTAFYEYLAIKNRFCTACNDEGKTECRRLSKIQKNLGKDEKIMGKCKLCNGTKKRKKGCADSTRANYIGRFDKLLRYFGLYNRIDFTNLKINTAKKKKAKRKPLRYDTLTAIIKYTRLVSRKNQWQFLAQSGARLLESCKVKKSDCVFVDVNNVELRDHRNMDRIKIMIRAEKGTKTREERETFVHVELQDYVLERLLNMTNDGYVFHDYDTPEQAESNEDSAFRQVRKEMIKDGYVEMAEMKPDDTQHRISLHTLRYYFISKANRINDSSFGDALAGHTEYMRALYDAIDEDKLLEMWKKSEKYTSLNGDYSAKSQELETTIATLRDELAVTHKENQSKIEEALKIERANMNNQFEARSKELYNRIFELMDKLEQKSK